MFFGSDCHDFADVIEREVVLVVFRVFFVNKFHEILLLLFCRLKMCRWAFLLVEFILLFDKVISLLGRFILFLFDEFVVFRKILQQLVGSLMFLVGYFAGFYRQFR
jgi:hypothetical protein